MATSEAYVSMMKVFVMFGKANTSMSGILFSSFLKANVSSILYEKSVEHNKSVRGAVRVA